MNHIDPEKETQRITTFIQETFRRVGFSDTVIGLSGGIDSSVSCMLAIRALGADHVFPVLMPYGALGTQGILDSMQLIEAQHIPLSHIKRIDIQQAVDTCVKIDPSMDRVRKGNIMARIRMIYVFDQAKKRNALVMGTENRSEHLLGYFTRFGDAASDIEPIHHLYKTQVYELATHIGVPQNIIDKPPSADLWPEQTDEGEFGFTYQEADRILSLLVDDRKKADDIIAAGYERTTVSNITRRIEWNAFKEVTPYALDLEKSTV